MKNCLFSIDDEQQVAVQDSAATTHNKPHTISQKINIQESNEVQELGLLKKRSKITASSTGYK